MWAFDIETAANVYAGEYALKTEIEQDRRLKDPVKIEADIKAKRDAIMERSGLRWFTGRVICIVAQDCYSDETVCWHGADERSILGEFSYWLDVYGRQLVGMGSQDFDAPFLIGRMMHHRLIVPSQLKKVDDVNYYFGYRSGWNQRGSLDDYAFGLRLPEKLGSGKDIQALCDTGNWEQIITYCKHDVHLVREIYRLYTNFYSSPNA